MTDTKAPSAWALERAMSIAMQARDTLGTVEGDDERDLTAAIVEAGVDVHGLLRRLLLAATEAKASAKAVKERMEQLHERMDRFKRREVTWRNAALGIMTALPELFPDGRFRDPAVDARVGQGKPGIVVTEPDKLDDRFMAITRTPIMAKIAEAINDGEVLEGASVRNGAPFITIRTS